MVCLVMFLEILRTINHLIHVGENGNSLTKEESSGWAFCAAIQCLLTCVTYFVLRHGSRGQVFWSVNCIKPCYIGFSSRATHKKQHQKTAGTQLVLYDIIHLPCHLNLLAVILPQIIKIKIWFPVSMILFSSISANFL